MTRRAALGQGGAPLGNLFAPVSDAAARATIDAAWDAGVRHFDTAPLYGFGLSERRMGDALRGRARAAFTLSTKVGRMLEPRASDPGPPGAAPPGATPPGATLPRLRDGYADALPFAVRFDYSAAAAERSLADSLQRLGLDRVDTAYIHDCAEDTHGPAWRAMFAQAMRGAAPMLERLKRAGTIRAWGLGVNAIEPCLLALEQARPDLFLLAGRYTLLDHAALDRLFPACAARGVRCVIGGPYNSGLLAGGDTFDYQAAPAALRARVAALRAVCDRHGVALKAAALQFCAAHPVVAAVIPGGRSAAEAAENAAMMRAPIPGALWADLRAAGLLPEAAPTP